jgi:ribonuclease PH
MSKTRRPDQLRKLEMIRDYTHHAAGSVLVKWGDTWVLCTACVEEKVPPFLRDTGRGWVTAEYSMLPSSTLERKERESKKGKPDARGTEISRLVGRALRAAVDMEKLGPRTITIDCDVLQADGGTRCASITGGYIALALAIKKLLKEGVLQENPMKCAVAAVSVGKVDGEILCDLEYAEDSRAEVDMNVVMTDGGSYVELQGTGEKGLFGDGELKALTRSAKAALRKIFAMQKKVIEND